MQRLPVEVHGGWPFVIQTHAGHGAQVVVVSGVDLLAYGLCLLGFLYRAALADEVQAGIPDR